jgi:hypothetical protein
LLAFSTGIDARIEKRAKETPIAEKYAKELIVIDVDVMKPRGVKEIITVDKNSDAAAMSEFPGRAGGGVKLHFGDP